MAGQRPRPQPTEEGNRPRDGGQASHTHTRGRLGQGSAHPRLRGARAGRPGSRDPCPPRHIPQGTSVTAVAATWAVLAARLPVGICLPSRPAPSRGDSTQATHVIPTGLGAREEHLHAWSPQGVLPSHSRAGAGVPRTAQPGRQCVRLGVAGRDGAGVPSHRRRSCALAHDGGTRGRVSCPSGHSPRLMQSAGAGGGSGRPCLRGQVGRSLGGGGCGAGPAPPMPSWRVRGEEEEPGPLCPP